MTAALLLAFLASGAQAGAPADLKREIRSKARELRDTRREVSQAERELKEAERKRDSILKLYESAGRQVETARQDLRTFQGNLRIVEDKLARISRVGEEYRRDITANRDLLRSELKALYKAGRLEPARLLFSSKQPGQLISRLRFMSDIARHNSRRMRDTRQKLESIEDFKKEYSAQELVLLAQKQAAQEAKRRAESEVRRRAALLKGAERTSSRKKNLLEGKKKAATELENLVLSLNSRQEEASRGQPGRFDVVGGPSRLGRALPWPVRGRLLSRFGEQMHPKFRTRIFNRGVEIAAPLGSPVAAVAPGKVGYAGYFEGYGQMVVLDHGGGSFTVYGHNSALQVKSGESVAGGQKIAEVGDSSVLGKPSLYFEVRSKAKAVDPLRLLAR